jgi:hypothetical protein
VTLDLSTARDRSTGNNVAGHNAGLGTLASSLRSAARAEVLDGKVNRAHMRWTPGRQTGPVERDGHEGFGAGRKISSWKLSGSRKVTGAPPVRRLRGSAGRASSQSGGR